MGAGGRVLRPRFYLVAIAVGVPLVVLLDRVWPGSLSALDVWFGWLEGLAFLALAAAARKLSGRFLGMPVRMACLALAACFFALAILETREALPG